MRRHPAKHELLDYAESLVDGRAISAQLGGHITRCAACLAEVAAMQSTLRVVRAAPHLEPSRELTARILLAAKNERGIQQVKRSRRAAFFRAIRAVSYAAGLVVVGTVWFGAASEKPAMTSIPTVMPATKALVVVAPSTDEIQKATARIQTFAQAVGTTQGATLADLQHRRVASVLDEDLTAAAAALQRNPGCVQAGRLITETLQQRVQVLQNYWTERTL